MLDSFQFGQDQSQQPGISAALTRALSGKPSYTPHLGAGATANYFKNAVMTPMMHAFNTQVAPKISEGFGGVGAFSSRRGTALSQALSDMYVSAGQQQANMALQNQQLGAQLNTQLAEGAAGRSLQATTIAQQLSQQNAIFPLQQAGAFNQLLAPYQGQREQDVAARYQEFLRTTTENSPYTGMIFNVLGQQQQAVYNKPSAFSSVVGGLTSLAGLGLLLDR